MTEITTYFNPNLSLNSRELVRRVIQDLATTPISDLSYLFTDGVVINQLHRITLMACSMIESFTQPEYTSNDKLMAAITLGIILTHWFHGTSLTLEQTTLQTPGTILTEERYEMLLRDFAATEVISRDIAALILGAHNGELIQTGIMIIKQNQTIAAMGTLISDTSATCCWPWRKRNTAPKSEIATSVTVERATVRVLQRVLKKNIA